ncbi:Rieske 2Fe-2S domain-containing protein [Caldivirga maquilingensis]|uniref:Rieske (2Fe-2S) domain protein n=1 Tax=Caldivirga maquilingensis (strain ATCC 700844 / DSM 13496 / JCM 10307 / IC-167) TaxID=397948 RepID=A8MBM2_CALMQ|nr:Rieske 2Fe-2S domain-containing protein [Caldivirga maquilingensis]ABW02755.1 Rieske (2Fe-2S) domain protein [Caldivirga maquilingensis IC-167]
MMGDNVNQGRRNFLKVLVTLAGVAMLASALPPVVEQIIPPETGLTSFPRLLLVDENGNPVKASQIPVNTQVILSFPYPLSNEPNMLLNLGDSSGRPVEVPPTTVVVPQTGASYEFPGGVGPYKSIVAYSGICQHLGCQMPLMSFYPNASNCQPAATSAGNLKGVIHCLCHGSTYDPYKGGAVVTGPTVRPLPAVVLEWDSSTDELYAVKMIGPVIYGHPGFNTPTNNTINNPIGDLQGGSAAGSVSTIVSNLGKLTQCSG